MQTMIDIFKAWMTPAAVLIFIGGMTWGVQLNVAVVTLQHDMGILQGKVREDTADMAIMKSDIQRLTITQNATQARLTEGIEHINQHNKEAEQWIRRILQNTGKIESLEDINKRFRPHGH